MLLSSQKIKEKMSEFTRLFAIERNLFQRFVIVYKYITLLNTEPLTKDILQKRFSETAKIMGCFQNGGMDEDKFLDVKGEIIYSHDFWMYYSNLEFIHEKMKKIKECKICDKKKFDDLCRLFSKAYSAEMLELSFKIINSNVFDHLDQKNFFDEENKKNNKTEFDNKRSILLVKGMKILINKQNKTTNAHKILHHIFIRNKKNLKDDFFFSEIAFDEFEDLEYKDGRNNWKRYHHSCEDINRKIKEQTNKTIKDFLIFNTGRKGSIKINPKYL